LTPVVPAAPAAPAGPCAPGIFKGGNCAGLHGEQQSLRMDDDISRLCA